MADDTAKQELKHQKPIKLQVWSTGDYYLRPEHPQGVYDVFTYLDKIRDDDLYEVFPSDFANTYQDAAHGIKDGNRNIVLEVSVIMAAKLNSVLGANTNTGNIREEYILVPVPGHEGIVSDSSRLLADAIGQQTGISTAEILAGDKRKSSFFDVKKYGDKLGINPEDVDFGFRLADDADKQYLYGKKVILVDNVLDTGKTLNDAKEALEKSLKLGKVEVVGALVFANTDKWKECRGEALDVDNSDFKVEHYYGGKSVSGIMLQLDRLTGEYFHFGPNPLRYENAAATGIRYLQNIMQSRGIDDMRKSYQFFFPRKEYMETYFNAPDKDLKTITVDGKDVGWYKNCAYLSYEEADPIFRLEKSGNKDAILGLAHRYDDGYPLNFGDFGQWPFQGLDDVRSGMEANKRILAEDGRYAVVVVDEGNILRQTVSVFRKVPESVVRKMFLDAEKKYPDTFNETLDRMDDNLKSLYKGMVEERNKDGISRTIERDNKRYDGKVFTFFHTVNEGTMLLYDDQARDFDRLYPGKSYSHAENNSHYSCLFMFDLRHLPFSRLLEDGYNIVLRNGEYYTETYNYEPSEAKEERNRADWYDKNKDLVKDFSLAVDSYVDAYNHVEFKDGEETPESKERIEKAKDSLLQVFWKMDYDDLDSIVDGDPKILDDWNLSRFGEYSAQRNNVVSVGLEVWRVELEGRQIQAFADGFDKAIVKQGKIDGKPKKLNYDPYQFISEDKSRTNYRGVLHEGGNILVTNGHILVIEKQDYPGQEEGKVFDKNGKVMPDAVFPDYKKLLDTIHASTGDTVSFDSERLRRFIAGTDKPRGKNQQTEWGKQAVQVKDFDGVMHFFELGNLDSMATAASHLKADRIFIPSVKGNPFVVTSDNGLVVFTATGMPEGIDAVSYFYDASQARLMEEKEESDGKEVKKAEGIADAKEAKDENRKVYVYSLVSSPYNVFSQPSEGFIRFQPVDGTFGDVVYDRPLTSDEIGYYGLKSIGILSTEQEDIDRKGEEKHKESIDGGSDTLSKTEDVNQNNNADENVAGDLSRIGRESAAARDSLAAMGLRQKFVENIMAYDDFLRYPEDPNEINDPEREYKNMRDTMEVIPAGILDLIADNELLMEKTREEARIQSQAVKAKAGVDDEGFQEVLEKVIKDYGSHDVTIDWEHYDRDFLQAPLLVDGRKSRLIDFVATEARPFRMAGVVLYDFSDGRDLSDEEFNKLYKKYTELGIEYNYNDGKGRSAEDMVGVGVPDIDPDQPWLWFNSLSSAMKFRSWAIARGVDKVGEPLEEKPLAVSSRVHRVKTIAQLEKQIDDIRSMYPDDYDKHNMTEAQKQVIRRISQAEDIVNDYADNIEMNYGQEWMYDNSNHNVPISSTIYANRPLEHVMDYLDKNIVVLNGILKGEVGKVVDVDNGQLYVEGLSLRYRDATPTPGDNIFEPREVTIFNGSSEELDRLLSEQKERRYVLDGGSVLVMGGNSFTLSDNSITVVNNYDFGEKDNSVSDYLKTRANTDNSPQMGINLYERYDMMKSTVKDSVVIIQDRDHLMSFNDDAHKILDTYGYKGLNVSMLHNDGESVMGVTFNTSEADKVLKKLSQPGRRIAVFTWAEQYKENNDRKMEYPEVESESEQDKVKEDININENHMENDDTLKADKPVWYVPLRYFPLGEQGLPNPVNLNMDAERHQVLDTAIDKNNTMESVDMDLTKAYKLADFDGSDYHLSVISEDSDHILAHSTTGYKGYVLIGKLTDEDIRKELQKQGYADKNAELTGKTAKLSNDADLLRISTFAPNSWWTQTNFIQGGEDLKEFSDLESKEEYTALLSKARDFADSFEENMDLRETFYTTSPTHYPGDDVVAIDRDYAVIVNNSVGGTYAIFKKVTQQEVAEAIENKGYDHGELEDLDRSFSDDVKTFAKNIKEEKEQRPDTYYVRLVHLSGEDARNFEANVRNPLFASWTEAGSVYDVFSPGDGDLMLNDVHEGGVHDYGNGIQPLEENRLYEVVLNQKDNSYDVYRKYSKDEIMDEVRYQVYSGQIPTRDAINISNDVRPLIDEVKEEQAENIGFEMDKLVKEFRKFSEGEEEGLETDSVHEDIQVMGSKEPKEQMYYTNITTFSDDAFKSKADAILSNFAISDNEKERLFKDLLSGYHYTGEEGQILADGWRKETVESDTSISKVGKTGRFYVFKDEDKALGDSYIVERSVPESEVRKALAESGYLENGKVMENGREVILSDDVKQLAETMKEEKKSANQQRIPSFDENEKRFFELREHILHVDASAFDRMSNNINKDELLKHAAIYDGKIIEAHNVYKSLDSFMDKSEARHVIAQDGDHVVLFNDNDMSYDILRKISYNDLLKEACYEEHLNRTDENKGVSGERKYDFDWSQESIDILNMDSDKSKMAVDLAGMTADCETYIGYEGDLTVNDVDREVRFMKNLSGKITDREALGLPDEKRIIELGQEMKETNRKEEDKSIEAYKGVYPITLDSEEYAEYPDLDKRKFFVEGAKYNVRLNGENYVMLIARAMDDKRSVGVLNDYSNTRVVVDNDSLSKIALAYTANQNKERKEAVENLSKDTRDVIEKDIKDDHIFIGLTDQAHGKSQGYYSVGSYDNHGGSVKVLDRAGLDYAIDHGALYTTMEKVTFDDLTVNGYKEAVKRLTENKDASDESLSNYRKMYEGRIDYIVLQAKSGRGMEQLKEIPVLFGSIDYFSDNVSEKHLREVGIPTIEEVRKSMKHSFHEDSNIETDVVSEARHLAQSQGIPMEKAERIAKEHADEKSHEKYHEELDKQEKQKDKAMEDKEIKAKQDQQKKNDEQKKAQGNAMKQSGSKKVEPHIAQSALILGALAYAKDHGGIFMNPSGKMGPEFVTSKTLGLNPYSRMLMTMFADQNNFRTDAYAVSRKAATEDNMPVKKDQKALPISYVTWMYKEAGYKLTGNDFEDRKHMIPSNAYKSLSDEDKKVYDPKAVYFTSHPQVFNIDQTVMPSKKYRYGDYINLLKDRGLNVEEVHEFQHNSPLKRNKDLEKSFGKSIVLFKEGDTFNAYSASARAMAKNMGYEAATKVVDNFKVKNVSLNENGISRAMASIHKAGWDVIVMDKDKDIAFHIKRPVDGAKVIMDAQESARKVAQTAGFKLERVMKDVPTSYDENKDTITYGGVSSSRPSYDSSYEIDKADGIYRAVAEAEQSRGRLNTVAIPGMIPSDARKFAVLTRDLSAGIIMSRQGLPARFSDEAMRNMPYYEMEFNEYPKMANLLAKYVNHTVEAMEKNERGIKENYAWVRSVNMKEGKDSKVLVPSQYTVISKLNELPNKKTGEFVVVVDKKTKSADVILPEGASLKEEKGMRKDRIEIALRKMDITSVRMYNAGGEFGLKKDNDYFKGKDVRVSRLSQYTLVTVRDESDDVRKELSNKMESKLRPVSVTKVGPKSYAFVVTGENISPIVIRPEKGSKDMSLYFDKGVTKEQRESRLMDLANKYYVIAMDGKEKGLRNIDAVKPDVDKGIDMSRIGHVSINRAVMKDGNGKPVKDDRGYVKHDYYVTAVVDHKQEKVKLTSTDSYLYRNLFLLDNTEKAEYKSAIAASLLSEKLLQEKRHSESEGKAVGLSDSNSDSDEEEKDNKVDISSTTGSVADEDGNGMVDDQEGLAPAEKSKTKVEEPVRQGSLHR